MNTRAKIMGLAALPLAGLLATGGVAMAQAAGTPAGTQVVRQAVIHKAGQPCPQHAVKVATEQAGAPAGTTLQTRDQLRLRDRDCANCGDHQQARTGTRTMEQARDGSCDHHADR